MLFGYPVQKHKALLGLEFVRKIVFSIFILHNFFVCDSSFQNFSDL